ncbi:hypothetical protein [Oscillatoria sp. FACHB-1406]|uniref:hypothetical protein n=1 Tax=Oscillatoria sp. FACHB-1406 TaxID=2692846 RepID=UPI001686037B|nr:hypothetical protein [Oscillatoria sp. FACHB-1406]MBD2579291.1 hypothetical protein [Oscillatoria sp. FACHB-1406]
MELKARMSRFQKLQQATQFAIAGAILATSLSFPAVASPQGAANCAGGGEASPSSGSQASEIPGWESSARTDPPTSPDGRPDGSEGGSSR